MAPWALLNRSRKRPYPKSSLDGGKDHEKDDDDRAPCNPGGPGLHPDSPGIDRPAQIGEQKEGPDEDTGHAEKHSDLGNSSPTCTAAKFGCESIMTPAR